MKKGNSLNLTKSNHKINIQLASIFIRDWMLSPKTEKNMEIPVLTICVQHLIQSPNNLQYDENKKRHTDWKGRDKLFLSVNNMIVYIEKSQKNPHMKLL